MSVQGGSTFLSVSKFDVRLHSRILIIPNFDMVYTHFVNRERSSYPKPQLLSGFVCTVKLLKTRNNAFERQCFYENISRRWRAYISRRRRNKLVGFHKCESTMLILDRWISLFFLLKREMNLQYPVNSSRLGDAYMPQEARASIIVSDNGLSPARHLAIFLTNTDIVNRTLRDNIQWNCNRKSNIFV